MTAVVIYGFEEGERYAQPVAVVENEDGSYSLQVTLNETDVSLLISRISPTNRSGTIAQASIAQEVMPINPDRRYMIIQNLSTTDTMYIDFNTDAIEGQPSLMLGANGGSFCMESSVVITDSVSIICATVGEPYSAREG